MLQERTMAYSTFKIIFEACLGRHAKCAHAKISRYAGFNHTMSPRLKRYIKYPESALAKLLYIYIIWEELDSCECNEVVMRVFR